MFDGFQPVARPQPEGMPLRESKTKEELPVVTSGVQIAGNIRFPPLGTTRECEDKGGVTPAKSLRDGSDLEREKH